ncbi:MAG: hypothetical protein LN590_03415 [Rickettsia endosymbiont of Glossina mortisans submortisans]|nr:hypothetical protein [Rickettsia endosymbiont of Glossina mortisans submortisans]
MVNGIDDSDNCILLIAIILKNPRTLWKAKAVKQTAIDINNKVFNSLFSCKLK